MGLMTDEYKERMMAIAKDMCFDNEEQIIKIAEELASASAVKVMSGRSYSDKLYKDINEKYEAIDIANAQEVLIFADEY